jgi:hypothetical protein
METWNDRKLKEEENNLFKNSPVGKTLSERLEKAVEYHQVRNWSLSKSAEKAGKRINHQLVTRYIKI